MKGDGMSQDKVVIRVKDHEYEIDRVEFEDPRMDVIKALSQAEEGHYAGIFGIPGLIGVDDSQWRQSDTLEFMEAFADKLSEVSEMTVPESAGSGTSSRSTAKKSNTRASGRG
ncbi:hypothetical protein [Cutibacterium avidum]|uniref:hypothetical protein n=1 Tax=Cutibacterium avidum TaxID=33010 RepID=UPI002FF04D05